MCGIFASNHPLVGMHHLNQINKRLKFRGPDYQSNLIECGRWKLYHSRLSIIAPTEKFSQPYQSDRGDWIVFNGEILNFHHLLIKHNLPKCDSDTEALTMLLELDHFDLSEVEGFFAFVRINSIGQLTHCARDRFGVKPLFFHRDGPYLTIASEASIISDIFELAYSSDALEEYRVFRAPVFSGSYFQNVEIINPGFCLKNGTFFNPLNDFGKPYLYGSENQNHLEDEISLAIKSRLVSDVPVGLLFSGGIDSNLIYTLCKTNIPRLTGGFTGDYDIEFARQIVSKGDYNPVELITVSDFDFIERFHDMVALRKEPLSVPNEVILSFLAEAWAARGGKVLLSGEAADEFFAGYDRIYKWAGTAKVFDLDHFIKLYCYVPKDQIPERLIIELKEFFTPISYLGPFEMVRYFFVKMHLPVLFRRLDFSLMFSGVEGREPFASYSLFKLALRYSPNELFRGNLGKLPLRLLAKEKINSEFALTSKVGFPVDLCRIFGGITSNERLKNYEIWYQENLEALKC